jgi:hypothetical protein
MNEERSFTMKRLLIVLAGLSVGVALTAGVAMTSTAGTRHAQAASGKTSVLIRHQMQGCHAWSVNGGAFRAKQSATVRLGATMTVTNNDVMPHKLFKLSGPALRISRANMNHMSATAWLVFNHRGTYRLGTKPGEDYPGMAMKTTGEDNVLRLTVKVT